MEGQAAPWRLPLFCPYRENQTSHDEASRKQKFRVEIFLLFLSVTAGFLRAPLAASLAVDFVKWPRVAAAAIAPAQSAVLRLDFDVNSQLPFHDPSLLSTSHFP